MAASRSPQHQPPSPDSTAQPWTLIGPGCLLRGDLVTTGNVLVHGRVEGMLFTDGELWIGPDASVEGGAHARRITVEGHCRGRLEADDAVILRPGSVVHGDVTAPHLDAAAGARFRGRRILDERRTPRVEAYRPSAPGNA